MSDILISIIIVNYKVPISLVQTLRSLRETEGYGKAEVIVVDNASDDRSRERVIEGFPEVKWIQLKQNIGFSKACNVGATNAYGKYLLFLNPDTIVAHTTLSTALDFMERHPDVGLVGPKILNPNGTLQRTCRRGFPTPTAAFYHFTGLGRLFPKSKKFGHYTLSYLDPDLSCQVDAISGSFMFLGRSLFEDIKGFDERFFMYGEDLDLCWRIKEKGYKVWYHPEMHIIHLRGKSAAKRLIPSRIAFYEAMILFSRKYQHSHRSFFPGWLIYVGIILQAILNISSKIAKSITACIIDLTVINVTLALCLIVRFTYNIYGDGILLTLIGIHALLSASFLFMFAYNGVYSQKRYSFKNALFSGFFASILFMACVYFIQSIAFSRIAFGIATFTSIFLLIGWREVLPRMLHRLRQTIYMREKVIVIGNGPIPTIVIQNLEKQKTASITGILWTGKNELPGQFEGYPVLGRIEEVTDVLRRFPVDVLLIATPVPWYSFIIEALAKIKAKNLTIRWVPPEIFDHNPQELPPVIPVHDFSV